MARIRSFTKIAGLSEARRLPRKGKIRLGIKATSAKGNEYPVDVDYFVVPPEVAEKYGAKPTELDIMFPVEDEAQFFPQAYKMYAGGLQCKGDGETALRRVANLVIRDKQGAVLDDATDRLLAPLPAKVDPNALVEIRCPCPLLEDDRKRCGVRAQLMAFLPRVALGAVYQIDTGSKNNVIAINSYIDFLRSHFGRAMMLPLKLRRVPTEIEYEGKKITKALLNLELDVNADDFLRLRAQTNLVLERSLGIMLPAPDEEDELPRVEVEVREAEHVEVKTPEPEAKPASGGRKRAAGKSAPEDPPPPPAEPIAASPMAELESSFKNIAQDHQQNRAMNYAELLGIRAKGTLEVQLQPEVAKRLGIPNALPDPASYTVVGMPAEVLEKLIAAMQSALAKRRAQK